MQHTLRARFRGALLGAAIGSSIGTQLSGKSQADMPQIWQTLRQTISAPPTQSGAAYLNLVLRGAESLAQRGRIHPPDWQAIVQTWQSDTGKAWSRGEHVLAALPVMLFFHEDDTRLRQHLHALPTHLSDGSEPTTQWQPEIWAVGKAIVDTLRETLAPPHLLPQLLATSDADAAPLLVQVQELLETRASLETVLTQLLKSNTTLEDQRSIALALYGFLSTADEFPLSLLRVARANYQPEITCTLVGALSGAHNGIRGIPPAWYLAKPQLSAPILQLADRVLASWSGVLSPASLEHLPQQTPAVAAPSVIRSTAIWDR